MPAYLISDAGAVAPKDQEAWNAYLAAAPATIEKYGGRYLVRGGDTKTLEGNWNPDNLIIVEFHDEESIRRWYASPEYSDALKIREGSGLSRNMIYVGGGRVLG